ncbi:hypothetical protein EPUS_01373 [Endocarpon pusillum Z07020]|uniref:DUF1742-domain-containing protein n=1 Tax=Endocarpon pusillum (strain Z07020 / HMAS-L-300199) TaxID=1263415 RepID=U1HYS3_ENDPU|nr:uncharacterized protein EPUS_01373 [Endocarpon pusillum Z07020]ERF76040.1 hypothetical protein EPUS_01373 [Endocarpon pusillum Z07020]
MTALFPNTWHLRTVAENSSKACYVCYKPTTRVLITPNNKDFFYICPGHLTDPGFASPVIDAEAEAAKAKKAAMDLEIEKVKQEYEEKQKRKKEKKKKGKKDDGKGKEKEKEQEDEEEDGKAEKERDDKITSIKGGGGESKSDDIPRIYALHRNFYQMRIDRIRNAEMAKRAQQRVKDPTFFPSAPKNDPQ